MKTKKIDVGSITGLSSYQLAVITGKFDGTLEEYVDKEMITYNDMVSYADKMKAEMEALLASLTEGSSPDLAEVIQARKEYALLGDRLDATDEQMSVILEKLNALDPDSVQIDTIKLFGSGKNIELRNNGVEIQWRRIGETDWNKLVALQDLTPNLGIGEVSVTENVDEADVTVSGSRNKPLLNFVLPRGRDGVDGGSIINMRLNEKGEGIVTVKNGDDDITIPNPDGEGEILIPVMSIGKVETLEYDQPAYVRFSESSTPTNLELEFGIPKGKPTKITKGYIDENGFLVFETE